MAEERSAETPQSAPPPAKKQKKNSKKGLLFFLLLLALGGGTGLHFSGLWDARPLFWGIVPQLPYVGPSLAKFFEIPERYALTVAERRVLELEDWQQRLDERERNLTARDSGTAPGEAEQGAERPAQQETPAPETPRQAENPDDTEKKLFDQVVRTYRDMSPRNSAQIVEQLGEPMAVELLQKLPTDVRGSILGKMDARKAARLTELMATTGQ